VQLVGIQIYNLDIAQIKNQRNEIPLPCWHKSHTNTLFTERGSSAGLYWLSDTLVFTDSCQIKWRPSVKVALRDVKCFSNNPQVTYYRHVCKWWHIYVSQKNTARVHLKCVAISSLLPLHSTASKNFAKPQFFHIKKGNCLSQTKRVYFSRSLWKPNSRNKYRCHPRS
jgi:hypothetical protein